MIKYHPAQVVALCEITFTFTFIEVVEWTEVFVCVVFFPLTASQAAAKARGSSAQHSAAASSITGMTVQEAQQILNISTLTPEEIQKVQTLLFFFHSRVIF